jgi:hypothetical protein
MSMATAEARGNGRNRRFRNIAGALLLFGVCGLGSGGCYYNEPYYGHGYAPVSGAYYAGYGSGYYDPYYDPYYGGGYYGPRYGGSTIAVGISSYGNRRYYGRHPRYRGRRYPGYHRRTGGYSRGQAIQSRERSGQRAASRVRAQAREEARPLAERQEE